MNWIIVKGKKNITVKEQNSAKQHCYTVIGQKYIPFYLSDFFIQFCLS